MSAADSAYAADGVDVSAEEVWSRHAHHVCKSTYEASPYVRIAQEASQHFRLGGGFTWALDALQDARLDVAADGLGTKPVLTAASGLWEGAAHDLLAMVAHDLAREGGHLALLTTVLSVRGVGGDRSPERTALERMLRELAALAKAHRFVLYKGETAQVGKESFRELFGDVSQAFFWEGVGHGVFDARRRIQTEGLRVGQVVVALREQGFRCNGISSVRASFERKFGSDWQRNPACSAYRTQAAAPSALYLGLLDAVLGWDTNVGPVVPVYGIAHITGGGLPGKFGEDILFRHNLSAELDDLWEPPAIMEACREWRDMSEEECYRTWNSGQGMLVVIDKGDAARFLALAAEQGTEARVCGTLTKHTTPELVVHSTYTGRKTLRYTARE